MESVQANNKKATNKKATKAEPVSKSPTKDEIAAVGMPPNGGKVELPDNSIKNLVEKKKGKKAAAKYRVSSPERGKKARQDSKEERKRVQAAKRDLRDQERVLSQRESLASEELEKATYDAKDTLDDELIKILEKEKDIEEAYAQAVDDADGITDEDEYDSFITTAADHRDKELFSLRELKIQVKKEYRNSMADARETYSKAMRKISEDRRKARKTYRDLVGPWWKRAWKWLTAPLRKLWSWFRSLFD